MQLFLRPLTLALSLSSASSFLASTSVRCALAVSCSSFSIATGTSNNHQVNQKNTCSSSSFSTLKMSAAEFAKSEIDSNKVVIFSKTYCPYCTKTKDLFKSLYVEGAVIHELDKMDNGNDIQAALLDISGQRTVPNVFINGKHVGGNDACQAANSNGQLKVLLGA